MVGMWLFKTCACLQLLLCVAMDKLPVDDAIPELIFDDAIPELILQQQIDQFQNIFRNMLTLTPQQQIDQFRNMLTLTVPYANVTPTEFLPKPLSSSSVKK